MPLDDPTDPIALIARFMLTSLNASKQDVGATLDELHKRVIVESTRVAAQTQIESPSMKSTPLPKQHMQKVQQLTKARAKASEVFLEAFGAMLAVSRLEKEEADLHNANRAHEDEAYLAAQASGLYLGTRLFAHHLAAHGVNKNHLERLPIEIVAVVADVIRWAVMDPDFAFEGSPMPDIMAIYANRSITKPEFRYGKEAANFSKPGAPGTAADPKRDPFYRYFAPQDDASEVSVSTATRDDHIVEPVQTIENDRPDLTLGRAIAARALARASNPSVKDLRSVSQAQTDPTPDYLDVDMRAHGAQRVPEGTPSSPSPQGMQERRLSPAEARDIATQMVERDRSWLDRLWPSSVATGENRRDVLLPALEARWSTPPIDGAIAGFLQAVRENRMESFVANLREARIADLAAKLERGGPMTTGDAKRMGLL